MPSHAPKRRKLEHHSGSDVEDDAASISSDASEESRTSAGSSLSNVTPKQRDNQAARLNSHSKRNAFAMPVEHTSLLQMQVAELLAEVTPNYASRWKKVSGIIKRVKNIIHDIPSRRALPPAEAEQALKRQSSIAIPFPYTRPPKDAKYTFAYARPISVELLGSFDLETTIRSGSDSPIDLHVVMPPVLLEAKDYLDHRYFYKRAYYLACLAAGFQKPEIKSFHTEYALQNENPLQPVLLISVQDSQETDLPTWSKIRVLVSPPADIFRLDKITPWAVCLRVEAEDGVSRSGAVASPFYNGSLCSELQASSYRTLLRQAKIDAPGFQGACRLMKVWLRQRQLGSTPSHGGFGNFEAMACITLMLLGGSLGGAPLLSKGTGSLQIFRALVQLLASRDLVENPLVLGSDTADSVRLGELKLPVIWDSTRHHNILFKMTTSSFSRLRTECQSTIQALLQPPSWRFHPTFIARSSASLRFDHVFQITSWSLESFDPLELSRFHRILTRALGDRARQVCLQLVLTEQRPSWPLDIQPSSSTFGLLVGITANSENVARRLDLGPSAEEKDAAADFRELWGEKAELRRFKDGSIVESVTWPATRDDRTALHNVLDYMLQRYFNGTQRYKLTAIGSDMTEQSPILHLPSSDALKPFKAAADAFKMLEDAIRAVSGQPLHVRTISTACSNLRYASLYPGGKHSITSGEAVMDVVIQFEGSTSWPDDIAAIQRTKVALLLKLDELLSQEGSFKCRVGLENEGHELLNLGFLDVTVDGSLFRLRIHHDREATLLDRLAKDKSRPHTSRMVAFSAISAYNRTFLHTPRHTQAMAALIVRFPLLSPAIRLLKAWIAAHLLTPHFPAEVIELIATHVFTFPFPYPRPGSLRSAFLRTLSFLARWDWRTEPLLVNLDSDHVVRAEVVEEVSTRLEAWRKVDPAMHKVAMFLASTAEHDGTVWSSPNPTVLAANRLTALAKAACGVFEAQGMDVTTQPLFTTSLAEFGFVIHLDPKALSRAAATANGSADFDGLAISKLDSMQIASCSPVRGFLEEIGRVYDGCIAFFHDGGVRAVIGGVWIPQATQPRDFRVSSAYSTMPVAAEDVLDEEADGMVTVNKAAILNEIARLGGDLISKITRQDDR